MSVLVQQLSTSMSRAPVPPDGAEAWRVTTDGGRGEDLYALWNSVFEGGHVTHDVPNAEQVASQPIPTQPRATAPTGQRPAQAAALADAPAGASRAELTHVTAVADDSQVVMQSDAADVGNLLETCAVGPTETTVAAAATASTASTVAATAAATASTAAATAAAVAATFTAGPGEAGVSASPGADASICDVQEPREVLQARIAHASIGAAYSVPAESARVFVHGAAVTVVVRNSTLSDQDAINTAFETARELTGQRSALSHLTLNGRTLYQQADAAAQERGATSGPNFVFAC